MMVILAVSVVTLAVDNELGNAPGSHVTTLYAILAIAGSSVQSVRIIRDLSQLAQTRQEARTDELTGTANRRALLARLEAAVSRPGGVCLLLIDLDRFKDVNDQHGHTIGDGLLRAVSRRLERLMPSDGLLARLGGDEFAVLLETDKAQNATILALALVDAISMDVEVDGRRLSIGASIGIAACRTDGDPLVDGIRGGELLRRADVAMYVAKESGSGVSVYHASVDAAILERLMRLDELSVVLADTATRQQRGELVVYYQPQLDADTRRIVGVEALVRWQHPRLGLIGPDGFLALAEDNGLMGQLTAHVLHEACAQAVRWRETGNPLRIAVNLSTSSLTDPDLLPLIDRALATSGLQPGALTVEITETTLMSDPEYSSLAYLSDLPATELKLDRSLTARVATDKRTAAVVAGTVELAHRLDLRLVAEGVEDEATLTALRALNCDEVQGYLFGKPGPAHLLDAMLALPIQRRSLPLIQGAHLVPPLTGRSVS
jgi:diguanylate cyclase